MIDITKEKPVKKMTAILRPGATSAVHLKLYVALFLTMATVAFGQNIVTGDITGSILDSSNASVASAKIVATSDQGATSTTTSSSGGLFRLSQLRPGVYSVVVSATGFQNATQNVTVSLGQVVPVTVKLGVQAQKETIVVTDASPLVQSENANLATTYDSLQLENLPAPGNDMTAYAFTAPGVTVSTGGGYGDFSAFGLPGTSNLFTINGSDNMDPYLNLNNSGASNLTLGSNELSEAAVVLNGYTGQYGRQAGAQVNYVTKSGTNKFHGNAGFFYNGRVLNANDWFNNATGTARPFSISRQWSDSIGGPIKKDKLFFFFNNEGLRYVLPSGGPVYIPTTNFAAAVLKNLNLTNPSAVPIYTNAFNVYAGASGAARATNVPITAGDPGGCGDIADPVFGVTQSCARQFQDSNNSLNTEWLMAVRLDFNPTNSDRFYFRYNRDRGVQATSTDPINAAFSANSVQPTDGGQMGYTKTIGSNKVNQLLLSGMYYSAIFGPPNLAGALSTFPTTFGFADGDYNSMGGGDNSYPQGRNVGQWQVIDDFSDQHGKHTWKVGVNLRRNLVSTFAFGPNTSGLYTFNSMTDFYNGSLANGSTYSQSFARIGSEPLTMYSLGAYAQDEWKVTSRVQATLSVRFDRDSNITCTKKCFSEFATPFASVAHNAATPYNAVIQTGLSQAFPSIEPVVVSPRAGVAWRVTDSTTIRAGVGLFTDLYQALVADRFLTNAPNVATFTTPSGSGLTVAPGSPLSASANVLNSFNAFQSGFASGATLAQLQASVPGFTKPNFNTVAGEYVNPKYVEWNTEVQHSFGTKYALSFNYVGNKGYDETSQNLAGNEASTKNFASLPSVVPDTRFAEIRELNNVGYSNYNGLVSALKWRTGRFSGSFSYTWSHALDTCSNACLEPFNALNDVSLRYQLNGASVSNPNYGNADYDVRHSMNANYIYTIGKKFDNMLAQSVLGGWTLAGTMLYHSGYPFSPVDSGVRSAQSLSNASGLATNPFLADWLGSGTNSCSVPNVTCLLKSQFSTAANQHDFGNIARNSFRGPGYFDTDLNVNKTFTVNERYKILVGAYFFNILNHANFDLPVSSLTAGTFGTITSTVSAPTSAYGSFQGSAVSGRVIQLVTKFTF